MLPSCSNNITKSKLNSQSNSKHIEIRSRKESTQLKNEESKIDEVLFVFIDNNMLEY